MSLRPLVSLGVVLLLGWGCATSLASLDVSTPMPDVVRIISPGPEIPPHIAAFSGVWKGEWDPFPGASQSLVVQSIEAPVAGRDYRVSVIMGWGDNWPGRLTSLAQDYVYLSGTISPDGVLRVEHERRDRVTTYRMTTDRQMLQSAFSAPGQRRQEGLLWRTDHFSVK